MSQGIHNGAIKQIGHLLEIEVPPDVSGVNKKGCQSVQLFKGELPCRTLIFSGWDDIHLPMLNHSRFPISLWHDKFVCKSQEGFWLHDSPNYVTFSCI